MDFSNMDCSDIYFNYDELEIYHLTSINGINPSLDFNPHQENTELGRLQDLNPQQENIDVGRPPDLNPHQENKDVGPLQDLNPQREIPEPEPEVETNNGHQLNPAAEPSSQPSRRGRRPKLTDSERKEHKRESDRRYRQKQNNILASWRKQQLDLEKQARETKSENDRMLHIHPELKQIQHLEEEIREIKSQRDVMMSAVQGEKMIMEWLACQPCNVTVPAAAAEFSRKPEENEESKIERESEGGADARFASKYLQDSPAPLREVEGGAGMSDWRRFVTEVVQSGGNGFHSIRKEGDSPPSKKAKITSSISSSDKGKGKLVFPSSTKVCVKSPTFGDICLRAADELGRNMLENPNEIATAIAHVGGDLGMNTAVRWVNHDGLIQACKEAVKEAASALFKMSNICDTVEKDFSHHSDLSAKLKASETKVIELQGELDARDKKISELEKSKVHLEGRVEHYRESFNESKASLKKSAVKMFKESSAFRAAAADKFSDFIDIGLRCAIEVAENFPAGSILTYEALNKAMAEEKGPVLAFLGQTIRQWITHDSLPPYSKNKEILIGSPDPLTACGFAVPLQSSTSATGTYASPAKVSTKTVTKDIEAEIQRDRMNPEAKVVDVEGDDAVRGAEEGALQEQDPQKADEGDEPGKDDL